VGAVTHLRAVVALVGLGIASIAVGSVAGGAINHPVPGIFGRITAGPTCPVERPGQQCAPRPVVATVKAQKRHRTVASTRSNSAGDYAMGLRAGTYTITVDTGSMFPRCPTKTITVAKGQSVEVNVLCDTGIR
jgi:hypothetical protein